MYDKKSFILYFDAYPLVALLPVEQSGMLFRAVYLYAMGIVQEPPVTQEEILAQFPEMAADTKMSCRAICNAITRDTLAWQRQREARMRRSGKAPEVEKKADSTARMRSCIQRNRQAEEDGAWNYI